MLTIRGEGAEVQVKGFGIGGAFVCYQLIFDEVVDALMGESELSAVLRVKHRGRGYFVTEPGDEHRVDRKEAR
jgi:hypothetical protein